MAASAVRSGHRVAAVESFRDLDHPALPGLIALEQGHGVRYSARRAAEAAASWQVDAVCYTASFENDFTAVEWLSRGRDLWGNPPAVLKQARDPLLLQRVLAAAGLPCVAVRTSRAPHGPGSWLLKPRRSGGGQRIQPWVEGRAIPRWGYLQQRIRGIPGSLLFLANGTDAIPVALTRQIVGDRGFGASGFRYVGNLIGSAARPLFPREPEVLALATRMAGLVTRRFGLRGINGIDFMARDGIPLVTEINPRWTGAAEVAERAYGVPLFAWHRDACCGQLPDFLLERARREGAVFGKAIVFARRELVTGAMDDWLGSEWLADIPGPGERIARGQPVCTVFARHEDAESTMQGLIQAQRRVLWRTQVMNRRAA